MKKPFTLKLLTSTMVLGALLVASAPLSANADDDNPKSKDSARVNVLGGELNWATTSDGKIQTPSLGFATQTIDGEAHRNIPLANGQNLTDTSDQYTGSELGVSDLRGSGAGYTVTAQLKTITGKNKGHELTGALINMKPDKAVGHTLISTEADAPMNESRELIQGGDAQSVMRAGNDRGAGVYTVDMNKSTLDVPNAIYADNYVGVLQYNMIDAPITIPTDKVVVEHKRINLKTQNYNIYNNYYPTQSVMFDYAYVVKTNLTTGVVEVAPEKEDNVIIFTPPRGYTNAGPKVWTPREPTPEEEEKNLIDIMVPVKPNDMKLTISFAIYEDGEPTYESLYATHNGYGDELVDISKYLPEGYHFYDDLNTTYRIPAYRNVANWSVYVNITKD